MFRSDFDRIVTWTKLIVLWLFCRPVTLHGVASSRRSMGLRSSRRDIHIGENFTMKRSGRRKIGCRPPHGDCVRVLDRAPTRIGPRLRYFLVLYLYIRGSERRPCRGFKDFAARFAVSDLHGIERVCIAWYLHGASETANCKSSAILNAVRVSVGLCTYTCKVEVLLNRLPRIHICT